MFIFTASFKEKNIIQRPAQGTNVSCVNGDLLPFNGLSVFNVNLLWR
jgi:hypothetical protein